MSSVLFSFYNFYSHLSKKKISNYHYYHQQHHNYNSQSIYYYYYYNKLLFIIHIIPFNQSKEFIMKMIFQHYNHHPNHVHNLNLDYHQNQVKSIINSTVKHHHLQHNQNFDKNQNQSSALTLSSILIIYSLLILILIPLLAQWSVLANPIGSSSSSSSSSSSLVESQTVSNTFFQSLANSDNARSRSSLENSFRNNLMKNTQNQVYIDTLTSEEAAEYSKTSRLPKRTMELIQKVLLEQNKLLNYQQQNEEEMKKSQESKSSSIHSVDLYEELFSRTYNNSNDSDKKRT